MTEMTAFTVRIPSDLAVQIDARAKINHRSRNAEITILLEKSIDDSVRRDLQAMQAFSDRQAG